MMTGPGPSRAFCTWLVLEGAAGGYANGVVAAGRTALSLARSGDQRPATGEPDFVAQTRQALENVAVVVRGRRRRAAPHRLVSPGASSTSAKM